VAALFRQLDFYKEFVSAGLVNNLMIIRDENAQMDCTVDFSPRAVLQGPWMAIDFCSKRDEFLICTLADLEGFLCF